MNRQENTFYKVTDSTGKLISLNSGSTGAPSNKSIRIQSKEFQSCQQILSLMSDYGGTKS